MTARTAISKSTQRGSALLVVFVLAAAVAIMLYQQMPRVAFETQREKELLLMERGAQFKRAIQLYYVANKKWPSKIEDLENTNDKRYLRRRYVDPMTGKDEWRMIHTNGVMLTDSLVQKMPDPASDKNGDKNKDLLAGNNPSSGNPTDPNAPPAVNAAVLQRPSDRTPMPGSTQLPPGVDPNDPNAVAAYLAAQQQNGQNGQPGQPGYPGGVPGQPNYQAGLTPGVPGFNPALAGQQFNPQIPGQPPFPGQTPGQGLPGQNNVVKIGPDGQLIPVNPQQPGVNGNPQQPGVNGQFPGQTNTGFNNTGFNNTGFNTGFNNTNNTGFNNTGFNNTGPGGQPGVAPNNAVQMINQMLTTPRQGGAPTSNGPFQNNMNGGLGLAGVASLYEGPSILVYGDRQKYNEWEFVFDLKQNTLGQQQTGSQGLPGGPNGQRPGGNGPGGMPNQPGNPFGGNGPGGFPGGPGGGPTTGTGGIGPIKP
jgi:hypothetical protein